MYSQHISYFVFISSRRVKGCFKL